MEAKRSMRRMVLAIAAGLGTASGSTGCDQSSSSPGTAAAISPEMKKKVADNLKDYPQRAAARAQSQRSKKP